jgi:ketosteroid isomerase-like protein
MRLAAILVAALVVGACGHGSREVLPPRPVTPPDVATAVRGTIEQWRQAYQVKSEEALDRLYAHDELVVVQDGRALAGWPAVQAVIKDRLERYQKIVLRVRDVSVIALGSMGATATGVMTRELGNDVTTLTETGTLTMVLRKDPDGWVIVTEHYSYRKGS